MLKQNRFSCFLIGANNLVIQCAEVLLEKGHRIHGIISDLANIEEWAVKNEIAYFNSLTTAELALQETSFDYLFSIANNHILPTTLLLRPRQLAINYHYAPLPRYAGVHSTSWAILNDEKMHGITWHVMTDVIDAGDILKQVAFNIESYETAFSLNLKCYQNAILAFSQLVDELVSNTYQRIPQDLKQRLYYNNNQKPPGNGWINWDSVAEDLDRLCRALYFGHYNNQFSLPKIKIGNEPFVIDKLQLLQGKSDALPGTLLEITTDGWRIATRTRDVLLLQVSLLSGQPCSLQELAIQYSLTKGNALAYPNKLVYEQFERLSVNYAKHEPYWMQALARLKPATLPFLPLTKIPVNTEKTRFAKVQSFYVFDYISEAFFHQRLQTLSLIEADYSNILMTLCLIYFYRLTNQNCVDVFYTYPILLQLPLELVPFIANQVPLSVKFDSELNFEQALTIVTQQVNVIRQHQTYLRDIVRRYPELAQFTEVPTITFVMADQEEVDLERLQFNSTLVLILAERGRRLDLLVDTKALEEESCLAAVLANVPGHIKTLFNAIIDDKRQTIAKLPLLTAEERQQILIDWNQTATDYPKDKTIAQLFLEQVKKTPENIAVSCDSHSLTYSELNRKADQLASYLQIKGVKPGDFVAICAERGIPICIAMLGILKSGAAYIPIDPNYPAKHINYILNDSNVRLILTSEKYERQINGYLYGQSLATHIISLTDVLNKAEHNNQSINYVFSDANAPAYIIYTSGTTGKPKGVIVRQYSVINLALAQIRKLKIIPSLRVLQFASISFDASVVEIYSTFFAGATLCIPSQDRLLVGDILSECIKENKINCLTVPPSILNTLPDLNLQYLKILITAGEACPASLAKKWCKKVLFVNAYGPTETTVCATIEIVKLENNPVISIGKPIDNTVVYILDKYLNILPVGIVGELYIGGDALALGYFNQPELTKEKFDIFSESLNIRLYKTGDLARWLPDGRIEYIGRIDNQVKIRGFRIELEEIQTQLLRHNDVSQCVVTVYQNEKNIKCLVAYFVTKKDKQLSNNELRAHLNSALPNYMIPSFFIQLKDIPVTINGKIDFRALPPPSFKQQTSTSAYVPPNTNIEKYLVEMWSNFFEHDKIGINDNFFDLGGDSILVTQLVLNLKKTCNFNLPLDAFLKNPTITQVSRLFAMKHKPTDSLKKLLINDIKLDSKIKPLDANFKVANIKCILLTGATGFLGAHLLYDLYRFTQATIYCLIRAETQEECLNRLRFVLQKYRLNLSMQERIIAIQGDLSKPLLGLSQKQYLSLAVEIDSIYHCGAYVHHIYSYEQLRAVNVLSTIELLKLAVTKKLKYFNYISTISAIIDYKNEAKEIIEDFITYNVDSLTFLNGYNQTKWVCERLLAEAEARGMPVKIYRPGWIMGQSDTGICSFKNQHLLLLIKGCLQMGYAPDWSTRLDISPVDFVSKLIVLTSINTNSIRKVFNICNLSVYTWSELIQWFKDFGYDIKLIPANEWLNLLMQIDKHNVLFPLLTFYLNLDDGIPGNTKLELEKIANIKVSNTEIMLKALNIPYIQIDGYLINLYVNFLIKVGFLTSPYNKMHLNKDETKVYG